MDVSVIIPTLGRPGKLEACLRGLASQSLSADRYEVLVGLDGPDVGAERRISALWLSLAPPLPRLRVMSVERGGISKVRNALLAQATGRVVVSLNDDVRPEPGLIEAHASGHAREPVIVVGDSPWVVHEPDRLFDRLIRETSMVFFYHRMGGADPGRDWGYRHAFGLNTSVRRDVLVSAGGYLVLASPYGYEDVELAHRLGCAVRFEPMARAAHDHRMDPDDYLAREHKLGFAAWGLAERAPACARDLFGRDVREGATIAYWREWVERERIDASRLLGPFRTLADLPAGAAPASMIEVIYQQHIPLKRWAWRRGFLDAAEGGAARPIDQVIAELTRPAVRLAS